MNEPGVEKLVVVHLEGARAGEVDNFQQMHVTIGRAPDSDLRFDSRSDRSVSGHHAVVRYKGNGFELFDANSTNGTFVNGSPIKSVRLRDGDTIRFGTMGPEVRISIPSEVIDHTTIEKLSADLYQPDLATAMRPTLNDPRVTGRVDRLRYMRFVRNTMVAAISVAAAMTAFVWTIIEGAGLEPAALYFKSFLFLVLGGVLITLVFAIYHGRPGRQRFVAAEAAWMAVIFAATVVGVVWIWKDAI